jgi:7-keto-8-aminopelargonate synthetase-like enzyme
MPFDSRHEGYKIRFDDVAGSICRAIVCGTQDIHRNLERKLADFHRADDAILYPSCFDANAGKASQILLATPYHAVPLNQRGFTHTRYVG